MEKYCAYGISAYLLDNNKSIICNSLSMDIPVMLYIVYIFNQTYKVMFVLVPGMCQAYGQWLCNTVVTLFIYTFACIVCCMLGTTHWFKTMIRIPIKCKWKCIHKTRLTTLQHIYIFFFFEQKRNKCRVCCVCVWDNSPWILIWVRLRFTIGLWFYLQCFYFSIEFIWIEIFHVLN